jgi:hypothetical protein
MRTKLVTLSIGIAMLGSIGLAQAETKAPVVTSTKTQMETTKAVQPQAAQRMALTDEQMGQVTAGHRWWLSGSLAWHRGDVDVYSGGSWTTYYNAWHRG